MHIETTINGITYRESSATRLMVHLHQAGIIDIYGKTSVCCHKLAKQSFSRSGYHDGPISYGTIYSACFQAARYTKEVFNNIANRMGVKTTDIDFASVMDSLGETYSVIQGLDAEYQQRRQALARTLLPQAEQLMKVIKKLAA